MVMRSFVAAASAGSFSAGAKRLGTSGSLVSRHIANLERQLDVRLVTRTARSIALTEQGRQYLEFSQRVLADIEREDAAIRGENDSTEGTLAILCPKWIGCRDLTYAVTTFASANPQLRIQFDLGGGADGAFDFIARGYDIEFHTKQLRDSSVKVRRIATLPFVLCAAPDYLADNRPLGDPSDLAGHRRLIHSNDHVWHFLKDGGEQRHRIPDGSLTSNSYMVLHRGALGGLGIAMLPLRLVFEDIRTGALQLVLPDYRPPSRPLYVAYPPSLQSVRKLRVFLDFVVDWFDRLAHAEPEPLEAARAATGEPVGGELSAGCGLEAVSRL
jgi:DNA-binding transcriptional LysR family regulator